MLPTTGKEDPEELVDGAGWHRPPDRPPDRSPSLRTRKLRCSSPSTPATLSEYFLLPDVPAELPRKLANKAGLYELCLEHGVPAPASAFPSTADELAASPAAPPSPWWRRISKPGCGGVRPWCRARPWWALPRSCSRSPEDWGKTPSVMLQEYVPREDAEDWIVHLYRDAHARLPGRVHRSQGPLLAAACRDDGVRLWCGQSGAGRVGEPVLREDRLSGDRRPGLAV